MTLRTPSTVSDVSAMFVARMILRFADGAMARSNGELIAKARQLTEDLGRTPATVHQARSMLGIKPRAVATP